MLLFFLRAGYDDNGGIEDNVTKKTTKQHKCQEGPNKEQEEETRRNRESKTGKTSAPTQ